MKKLLLLAVLSGFILMQGVALGYDASIPMNPVITRSATTMDVVLNGTTPGYRYMYSFWAGRNIYGVSPVYLGSAVKGNVTGGVGTSTTIHAPVTLNDLPFDGFNYTAAVWVSEYDDHGVYTGDWEQNWSSFNISYTDTGETYQLFIGDADPSYLSLYGGDAAKTENFQFNASFIKRHSLVDWYADKASIPVYVFITDNTTVRHVIAWQSETVSWGSRASISLTNRTYWGNHISMSAYTTPMTAHYGTEYTTVDVGWKYHYYTSYYIYIGYKTSDYPSLALTFDNTVYPMNFSVDSGILGVINTNSHIVEGNGTYTGCLVYFETTPSIYGPHGTTFGFTPSSFGVMVTNYGMTIGIPFFSLIIAFLVIGIFCFAIFSVAARFDLAIPNVVYGIAVIAGMTLDYALGLVVLWMFILFALVVALVSFLTFREQIEGVYGAVTGKPLSMRHTALAGAVRPSLLSQVSPRRLLASMKKEQGVLPKHAKLRELKAYNNKPLKPGEGVGLLGGSRTTQYLQPPPGYHWEKHDSGKRVLMSNQGTSWSTRFPRRKLGGVK